MVDKPLVLSGVAGGLVLAASETVMPTSDPTVMVYTLAAGAMALLTLLVKDKVSPRPAEQTVSGQVLFEKLEKLAYGVDEDRDIAALFRKEIVRRFDTLERKFMVIEMGVAALRANQDILAEESSVASWRSDAQGQCVWASHALRDMVGYSFTEGFEGTNWINIYPQDEIAHVQHRWADAVRTRSTFSMRSKYQHKDGTIFPVQLRAECLPDGSFRGVARKL